MSKYHSAGRVFDIQRYSIHDGNGIRTLVFLKGCFLRCRWCCNPESQEYAVQTMDWGGKQKIVGKDMTVAEVMRVAERDRPYYNRSGGGITLSGGEALAQPDFTRDLLCAAAEAGLHTAMESTLCAEYTAVEGVLPYLNQLLLDIKHMNALKHKAFTGKTNDIILENAAKAAKSGMCEIIVRVPVIPSFNDTVQEIRDIAGFAAKLAHVSEMHLLPYHRLGQDKYAALGREYTMADVLPPTDEHMERLRKAAESMSVRCFKGGG